MIKMYQSVYFYIILLFCSQYNWASKLNADQGKPLRCFSCGENSLNSTWKCDRTPLPKIQCQEDETFCSIIGVVSPNKAFSLRCAKPETKKEDTNKCTNAQVEYSSYAIQCVCDFDYCNKNLTQKFMKHFGQHIKDEQRIFVKRDTTGKDSKQSNENPSSEVVKYAEMATPDDEDDESEGSGETDLEKSTVIPATANIPSYGNIISKLDIFWPLIVCLTVKSQLF